MTRIVELQPGEAGVEPVLRDEFGMAALLDHAALVDDYDPVGLQHSRQPVGNDQRRAALHQARERFLHQGFAFRVER